jgi:stage IV sporulation protein FB
MNATDNFFSLAVPLGRFMGTRLKLSALMLIAVLAVIWRVQSFTTTIMFSAVMFLSVCLHELSHVWMSHRAKLPCPERILWPFGGFYGRAPHLAKPLVTLAGPCVCLVLAIVSGVQLQSREEVLTLINPATCWQGLHSDSMLTLLPRIGFFVNFLIVVANLIPVRPMAAGYALQNYLSRRYSNIESRDLLLRSGMVISIFGLLAGFVFDLSGLAALSALLLLIHVQEAVQWFQPSDSSRSFGTDDDIEDFATPERYASDDFNNGDDEDSDSVIDRWKDRRESERDLRERELEQREHDELDRVLEKLHLQGRDALSVAELHLLNRVSARLRQKNH